MAVLGAVLAGCTTSGFGDRFKSTDTTPVGPIEGEVIGTGEVRVALLIPKSISGGTGRAGNDMYKAAKLAMSELDNPNIKLLVKDTAGAPAQAKAAARQATREGAELIIGPMRGVSTKEVASVARSSNVPVLSFTNDATVASSGVYVMGFNPELDVERIISYAGSQGKQRFAAILPSNAYGGLVEPAFRSAVARSGGQVVWISRYALDIPSIDAAAEEMANSLGDADVIFVPDGADVATRIISKIWQTTSVARVQVLGTGQWVGAKENTLAILEGAWYSAPDQSRFADFERRFRAANGGETPLRIASIAYDAVTLAAGLATNFGQVRFSQQTIANPNGFSGVDGTFRFKSNGRGQRALAVYGIVGGAPKILDGAPQSFASNQF
jgi:ABC-type branched-subunit amino acid transport system substrate-binding protein